MGPAFDVAVVLGAALTAGGEASPALLRRTLQAAALYHQGVVPVLLLSGGAVRHSRTEASAMREAAREAGVPDGALILEDRSRNTLENALFCRPIIHDRGWGRILVVTDGYHLRRSLYTFRRLGIPASGAAAPPPGAGGRWGAGLREMAALAVYVWRINRALKQSGLPSPGRS